jgi:hypothetical protein
MRIRSMSALAGDVFLEARFWAISSPDRTRL